MARTRKRHVQQELFRHGGKRAGAGRKPKGARAGAAHKKRPFLKSRFPVHVVLRVAPKVGSLRKRLMYRAIRMATITVAKRELAYDEVKGAFRIIHISIQRTHVHLLVEADNRLALSRGMQSFQISAAKHINAAYTLKMRLTKRRRGTVFPDRFHQEIITTPRQVRRALAYVLNNWRKHREDRASFAKTWNVDPYSTGLQFDGWKELEAVGLRWLGRKDYQSLVVYLPHTWLLGEGWRKHGTVSFHEVPSSPPVPRVLAA